MRDKLRTYPRLAYLLTRRPLIVNQPLEHLRLNPSSVCNLNCRMCPNSYTVKDKKTMTFTDFKRILDSTKAKRLTLVGSGETFFNPEIIDILNYAGEKCSWFSTTTNFTIVGDIIEDIIHSNLDVVKISIDGATEDTYNRIRRGAEFDTIVDNIASLVEAKTRLHSERPYIRFNYVVQYDNYKEIDTIVELAHDLGVTNIVFLMVRTSCQELMDIPYEELITKMKKANELTKKFGIWSNLERLLVDLQIIQWGKYAEYCNTMKTCRQEKFYECIYPWLSAYIDVHGTVTPCCSYRVFSKRDRYGNALKDEWKDIWNGAKFQYLRYNIKNRLDISPSCLDCNGFSMRSLVKIDRMLPHFT